MINFRVFLSILAESLQVRRQIQVNGKNIWQHRFGLTKMTGIKYMLEKDKILVDWMNIKSSGKKVLIA